MPCAYCGKAPAGTLDHVPPKCFFASPLPKDLITVPGCKECNVRFSSDDLYAHLAISSRQDVGAQPRLSGVIQGAMERFDKPRNHRLRGMMAQGLSHRDVEVRSGVIVPGQDVLMIDRPRVIRWLERIFRGLHYHETMERVPDGYTVTVGLGEDHPDQVKRCVEWFRQRPLRTCGAPVFEYKWMPMPDCPEASLWCAEFYHVMPVLGFILPPGA